VFGATGNPVLLARARRLFARGHEGRIEPDPLDLAHTVEVPAAGESGARTQRNVDAEDMTETDVLRER
jgi:hypothetical protein